MGTPAILVVDNDPNLHAALAQALGPVADVELAINGAEALRLLARKKYGVLLLELNVRLIDGFVILRTLAAKAGPNKDTPVYVLTGDVSEHVRLRALREHALFVLTKPVPIATVATLVEATLRKGSVPPPESRPSAPRSVPPSSSALLKGSLPPPESRPLSTSSVPPSPGSDKGNPAASAGGRGSSEAPPEKD